MALREAIVVCTTSFLLGILFTHWIADSLTLWKTPITNEHLRIAASYYSLHARTPSELGYFLALIVTTGAITIIWSLRKGATGNLMFDGGSIFLYGTAVAMYLNKVLPGYMENFLSLPKYSVDGAFPPNLRAMVLNLASSNLVCSVALTGVLALQAGRYWAERSDSDEDIQAPQESAQ